MKIAVLGTGNIGGTLGRKWAAQGHELIFGTREPQTVRVQALLAEIGNGATAVSVPDALSHAGVVLFAIPGRVMAETVRQLGDRLNGKILIDATNNISQQPMHSLNILQQVAPDSPCFRAFSTLGWENFAEPVLAGQQIDLFYCGDGGGGEGQTAVHQLISDIGLRPVYVGGIEQADIIDALTHLYFALAYQQGHGRRLAFKTLGIGG
jgi:8-hydroxy-5-deazaflavin:NADPH oxidoreductase